MLKTELLLGKVMKKAQGLEYSSTTSFNIAPSHSFMVSTPSDAKASQTLSPSDAVPHPPTTSSLLIVVSTHLGSSHLPTYVFFL